VVRLEQKSNSAENSMSNKAARAWIGTSGWEYPHWKKRFYPEDMKASEHLAYYATEFCTAEINNSFYRLPAIETYEKWAEEVPKNFLFAVKASRYLTHMKKLKDSEDPWHRVTSTSSGLNGHLGPVLLQFPAKWKKNIERLNEFLEVAFADDVKPQIAFEFRHPTWYETDVIKLLEKYGCALCIVDAPEFVRKEAITSDFTYIRYHGRESLYASKYTRKELEAEAEKISDWLRQKITVYAYFNNDGQAFAVANARQLNDLHS
jgi:uncharacterized protein YecE (DUF72 family)